MQQYILKHVPAVVGCPANLSSLHGCVNHFSPRVLYWELESTPSHKEIIPTKSYPPVPLAAGSPGYC